LPTIASLFFLHASNSSSNLFFLTSVGRNGFSSAGPCKNDDQPVFAGCFDGLYGERTLLFSFKSFSVFFNCSSNRFFAFNSKYDFLIASLSASSSSTGGAELVNT